MSTAPPRTTSPTRKRGLRTPRCASPGCSGGRSRASTSAAGSRQRQCGGRGGDRPAHLPGVLPADQPARDRAASQRGRHPWPQGQAVDRLRAARPRQTRHRAAQQRALYRPAGERARGFGDAQTDETRVAAFDGRGRRVGGGLSDHGRARHAGSGCRRCGGAGPSARVRQGRTGRHSGRGALGSGRGVGNVEGGLALHGAGGVGAAGRAQSDRARRRCADRTGNAPGGLLRPGGTPLRQPRPGAHSLPSPHGARILQGVRHRSRSLHQ